MQNRYIPVTALFIILTILLITPISAANGSCSLSVASIPQGGEVIIDSSNYGNTPVMNIPLSCGLHSIGVMMEGYANYASTARLDEEVHQDIVANLQRIPNRAQVSIRSVPPEGDLYIDGKARGVTPLTVDNLVPGRHEIQIMKTGYEDYHDVISAATDITTEYTEYLAPLPDTGFLSIASSPEGAFVRTDGRESGKTPTNLQRIGAGDHTIEIYQDGYWNFTGIVNVKAGEAMLARADLIRTPTTSSLYLDSLPQGQGIYLNDTFKGFTPATFEMPPGDYLLRMYRPQNGALVNQSFRFTPGSKHEIFAFLDNKTGGSATNHEWLYQNESRRTDQPGWRSVNTTPVVERRYTWIANGHQATITLDIPQSLYDYYKNQPHPRNASADTFESYAINENDRQYLHNLVEMLKDASDFKSYRARNDYRNVIAFVQGIAYKDDIDPAIQQKTDYWQYPVETLAEGTGDCEDTAILTAALLKEMGYEVAIILLPEHAAVAVTCDNCNGYYYPLNGKRYYYLETTRTGYSLGTKDKKYQASEAKIIPL
ncbi:MAG: PEGA domain-containing protein [Methanoregula sp.]|nr:PEGA domain-containing protein [Methanoregula sp.]